MRLLNPRSASDALSPDWDTDAFHAGWHHRASHHIAAGRQFRSRTVRRLSCPKHQQYTEPMSRQLNLMAERSCLACVIETRASCAVHDDARIDLVEQNIDYNRESHIGRSF